MNLYKGKSTGYLKFSDEMILTDYGICDDENVNVILDDELSDVEFYDVIENPLVQSVYIEWCKQEQLEQNLVVNLRKYIELMEK